jgi:tRNA nucleotidyltransferase/poly(A) polymerase
MNYTFKKTIRPLKWPDIANRLSSFLRDSESYFVGGIVRDAISWRASHDIDLVTLRSGLQVAREIANRLDGDYYALDTERQVGRVIISVNQARYVIDVASVRGDSIDDDLRLRDFTINAMLVDPTKLDQIYDPLEGYEDLLTRHRLKECSSTSIADDPIRALRAIRLSRQFGLRMEKPLQVAIRRYGSLLRTDGGLLLQPERVRDEMVKILGMPDTSRILRVMDMLGILNVCLPDRWESPDQFESRLLLIDALGALMSVISRSRDDNTASNLLLGVAVVVLDQFRSELGKFLSLEFSDRKISALMLMFLLTPPQLTSENWVSFFRLSRAEGKFIKLLSQAWKYPLPVSGELDDRHIHQYYRESNEAGIGGILLQIAEKLTEQTLELQPELWGEYLESSARPFFEAYFKRHQSVIAPPPLVTGDDLQQASDIKPGREMGEILKSVLEAQAAGEVRTKKQALRYASNLLRQSHRKTNGT